MSFGPLNNETLAIYNNFSQKAPQAVIQSIGNANSDFASRYDASKAIQVGSPLPEFRLPDALGNTITSTDLLAKGPLLINFYRGEWCPFCNIALHYMQEYLPKYQAKGVTLVAISPELPDTSLTTTEKHNLKFPVLSDVGNAFAKKLGIVYQMPDSMRAVFKNFGDSHDLKKKNGDDSFAVPIPATFLIDRKGVVRNSYIETDYVKRLEPETALEWIEKL